MIIKKDYKKLFKYNDNFAFYSTNKIIPDNGWKIHISCDDSNYKKIGNICFKYLLKKNIWFKFVYDDSKILKMFSKNENITFAGKFITIYPENSDIAKEIIEDLYELLKSFYGIPILGDYNYKNSIIFYRFGNFFENKLDNIKKDEKKPFLNYKKNTLFKNIKIKQANTINEEQQVKLKNKYKIIKILRFTNHGTIILAENQDKKYIIKEARYKCNLEINSPLFLRNNEMKMSKSIKKYVPNFIEKFKIKKSTFFVYDFLEGDTLFKIKDSFNILLYKDKYLKIFTKIIIQLLELMIFFHKNKIIINDIKLDNFIIDKNLNLFFIDLEGCLKIKKNNKIFTTNNVFNNLKSTKKNYFWLDRIKLAEMISKLLGIDPFVYSATKNIKIYFKYLQKSLESSNASIEIYYLIFDLINCGKINLHNRIKILKDTRMNSMNINKNNFSFISIIKMLEKKILNKNKIINNYCDFFDENNLNLLNQKIIFFILDNNFVFEKEKEKIFEKYNKYIISNKDDEFDFLVKDFLISYLKYELSECKNILYSIFNRYVVKIDNCFFAKINNYYSPYFLRGTAGILFLFYLFDKIHPSNVWIIKKIEILYNSLIILNPLFLKTTISFGFSGISFVIFVLGKDLNKQNFYLDSIRMLENLNYTYNYKKNIFYSQNKELNNNSFFEGTSGIIWWINFILKNKID